MKLIGLTGGIASGKSSVTQMLRDEGQVVVDADELAREVVEPGTFGLRALAETFGEIVLDGHRLDRKALREKIFEDEQNRLVVERILHPLIHWRAQREFERYRRQNKNLLFYDAALIFEKDLVKVFDGILVVYAPIEAQLKRLIARDKISQSIAEKILSTQWPIDKKRDLAQYVIDNSQSLASTKKQVSELLKNL